MNYKKNIYYLYFLNLLIKFFKEMCFILKKYDIFFDNNYFGCIFKVGEMGLYSLFLYRWNSLYLYVVNIFFIFIVY